MNMIYSVAFLMKRNKKDGKTEESITVICCFASSREEATGYALENMDQALAAGWQIASYAVECVDEFDLNTEIEVRGYIKASNPGPMPTQTQRGGQ